MATNTLLTFYGDDFTGSTDALDGLARGGISGVLFVRPPDKPLLEAYAGKQAVGIAGVTRALGPQAMHVELQPALRMLQFLGAPICHYKVCSTFDSSPTIGNIGTAIETGRSVFGEATVPVMVGVPILGRYVAFGTLFARYGNCGQVSRIDRHPVMSVHPVTPMREADLREHLSQQTDLPLGLWDIPSFETGEPEAQLLERLRGTGEILVVDTLTRDHLLVCGTALLNRGRDRSCFVVGSSGVEYALVEAWSQDSDIEKHSFSRQLEAVPQIVVVSGSCSSVTAEQIEVALGQGFCGIEVPPNAAFIEGDEAEKLIGKLTEAVTMRLAEGKSVVVHTAMGPDDPRIAAAKAGRSPAAGATGEQLGNLLGKLLKDVSVRTKLRRSCIAGGDTSSFATRALGVDALEVQTLTSPAAPLCRALKGPEKQQICELVLKGGQIGPPDYFVQLRDGVSL